jgi:hypothetical protein
MGAARSFRDPQSAFRNSSTSIRLLNRFIADFAGMGNDACLKQLVVQIERQRLALLIPKMLNESAKIV